MASSCQPCLWPASRGQGSPSILHVQSSPWSAGVWRSAGSEPPLPPLSLAESLAGSQPRHHHKPGLVLLVTVEPHCLALLGGATSPHRVWVYKRLCCAGPTSCGCVGPTSWLSTHGSLFRTLSWPSCQSPVATSQPPRVVSWWVEGCQWLSPLAHLPPSVCPKRPPGSKWRVPELPPPPRPSLPGLRAVVGESS